jgi:hypothetical protein
MKISHKRRQASHVLVVLSVLGFFLLSPIGNKDVEATLPMKELVTTGNKQSLDNNFPEVPLDIRKPEASEKRLFGEMFSSDNVQKGPFQSPGNSLLRLKSPGKLPGIEFGIELHSLQAFQSVIPSSDLPPGLHFKQEQPLILPPSSNIPDYNGGFLRFTW